MDRDSVATCSGLHCLGIEFQCESAFLHSSTTTLASTQPPAQRVPSLFPRGKAAGTWGWLPALYIYSPIGSSWPILEWNLLLFIIIINIKDWTLWSIPSPKLQLLSPTFLQSSNCSPSLWSVVVWFLFILPFRTFTRDRCSILPHLNNFRFIITATV